MNRAIGPALFLVCLAVYFHSVCPTIFADDSPETVVSSFTCGISHPPGDPMLQISGKLWSFLPLGGPGLRINFLSCLLAAILAYSLWSLSVHRRNSVTGIWAALAVGILLCANPMLRQQAAVAKGAIYAANLLILVVAARAYASANPILAAGCAGLLFSHHWMSLAAFSPLFALFIFSGLRRERLLRQIALFSFVFAVAASLWLVLPIRAVQSPSLNSGDPSNCARFISHFIRKPYLKKEMRPTLSSWTRQTLEGLAAIKRSVSWPGMAMALIGAASLYNIHRGALAVALAALACPVIASSIYLDLRPQILHLLDVFLLPSSLALTYLAVQGVLFLQGARIWRILAAILLGSTLLLQYRPLHKKDVSLFTWSFDTGRALLAPLPPGAGIVVTSDLDTFPLWYHQQVEGYRKEVLVVNRVLLGHPWYQEAIFRIAGIRRSDKTVEPAEALSLLFAGPYRPWFTSPVPLDDLPRNWRIVPYHLSFRIGPGFSRPVPFSRFSWRGVRERAARMPDPYSLLTLGYLKEANRNLRSAGSSRQSPPSLP